MGFQRGQSARECPQVICEKAWGDNGAQSEAAQSSRDSKYRLHVHNYGTGLEFRTEQLSPVVVVVDESRVILQIFVADANFCKRWVH